MSEFIMNPVPYDQHKTPKSFGRARPRELEQFRVDRVNKLKELYEIHTPQRTYKWVMPKGETDGRKAKRYETIVGEDISPFDLSDFEEQMPKIEDYIVEVEE